MNSRHCCEMASLVSVLGSAFGYALNVLPPIAAVIASCLGAYYYLLQIRKLRKGG